MISGGSAENYPLELGSNTFIPGFEDQLVGVKTGDVKDVVVTFPEDYNAADLAGKEAVFKCTVHDVKYKELPEANDELIQKLKREGVDTLEKFKEVTKEDINKEYENMSKTYGMDVDRIKQIVSADNIRYDLAQQKAVDLIKSSVK